jgi:hypothetical protein
MHEARNLTQMQYNGNDIQYYHYMYKNVNRIITIKKNHVNIYSLFPGFYS